MENSRIVGKWLAVFVFCALLAGGASSAEAGVTGKVVGYVKDAEGHPLPYANVVVAGTRRGAVTDEDGYFFIIGVDVGIRAVKASMVGYESEMREGVEVNADYTEEIDFTLREKALMGEEVVVTAVRPLVELDQTASRYVTTYEDIQRVPMVRDLNTMVALHPGVEADGSNVIRGGNNSNWSKDVTYYVDGVRLVHTDGGSSNFSGLFRAVNASAIQEVQVIVGGMEAEYGNIQAGVINVITRDGRSEFGGSAEYKMTPAGKKHWKWDAYDPRRFLYIDPVTLVTTPEPDITDPVWAGELYIKPGPDREFGTQDDEKHLAHEFVDYTGVVGHRGEVMVNGPLGSKASFIATAATTQEAAVQPGPDQTGYSSLEGSFVGYSGYTGFQPSPFNLRSSGKLSFRPMDNVSLKLGVVAWHATNFEVAQAQSTKRDGGDYKFFLLGKSDRGKLKNKDDIFYVSLQHSLSPRTLYEARLSGFITRIDTADVPLRSTPDITDKDGRFTIDRDYHRYTIAERNRLQFRFDLSSQVTKGHFLKAGLELTRYDTWSYAFELSYGSHATAAYTPADIETFGETIDGDPITNVSAYPADQEFKYNNGLRSANWNGLTGNGLPIGRGGNAFKPVQFAVYVQDKMEFQGMVVNAGLRFDALWPNATMSALPGAQATSMFDNHEEYLAVRPGFDPIDDILNPEARYLPLTDTEGMYQVSPRIGVSHPITDRSLVRFAFGKFYQVPNFGNVYAWDAGVSQGSIDVNGDGEIGDREWGAGGTYNGPPWRFVRAEQTFNMEVGFDWNFVADYTMSVATYYKSANDQQMYLPGGNAIFDPRVGARVPYDSSPPDGFEDARGIEFSIRKAFSNYFAFSAAYNANWRNNSNASRSTRYVVPDSAYTVANWWNSWEPAPNGSGGVVPVLPDAATVAAWGHIAAEELRGMEAEVDWTLDEEVLPGLYSYREVSGADPDGPSAVEISTAEYFGTTNSDRRHNASLTVTLGTPRKFGPGVRGLHVLGGLRANLVYRFYSGIPYLYKPTSGGVLAGAGGEDLSVWRWTTITTFTDLSLLKTVGTAEGVHADFFLEATNIFNQQNLQLGAPPSEMWDQHGWPQIATYAGPDHKWYRNNPEYPPGGGYSGQPRILSVGMRVFW